MNKRKIIKASALISALSGVVILSASTWPIIEYQLVDAQNYQTLLTPLSLEKFNAQNPTDYTKASNWFPDASQNVDFNSPKVTYYTLSIPKLRIENASVAIGGEDLSKSLVQYPGTALPGKRGNAVIFGHSILPIFYNPKNYMAIFSTLPTLRNGDEIFINYDGVNYKFVVEEVYEIFPSDIQILEQDPSDSFITLVTCTPPGDPRNPKRLIVKARVVS